jgi:hypothetical protein
VRFGELEIAAVCHFFVICFVVELKTFFFVVQQHCLDLGHLILDVSRSHTHGDQKVPVHLMITIKRITSNVQSVPHRSPDIY